MKFSPSSLTIYYSGSQSALQETTPFGDQAGPQQFDFDLSTSSGMPAGQYVYSFQAGTSSVNSIQIPLSAGYKISIAYPSYALMDRYGTNNSTFSCNSYTFNSAVANSAVGIDSGETTQTSSGVSTNWFEVRDGGVHEISSQDEAIVFKNGAQIDFDPSDKTFSIQKGNSSTTSSVELTSSTSGKATNLSLNQNSYNNPFASGNQVEVSTTSSNPITSEKNTFNGDVTSAADLTSKGWNIDGENTVVNRYSQVQLYWQPSSQDLPLYRYMLYKYLGDSNFNSLRIHYPEFFEWLVKNPEALNQFLTSGYASASTIVSSSSTTSIWGGAYLWGTTLDPSSELSALEIWAKIWKNYPGSRGGEDLKIAVAVALDFAHNVVAWQPGTPINPLGRYEIYATAFANNTLIGTFGDYSAQMLRDVVDDRISNAGLKWLRSYMISHADIFTIPPMVAEGSNFIKYLEYSPYGFVQDGGFYGPKATIWNVMRYAGSCVPNSSFSVFLLNAFGMPGWAVYQPGHCAYVYFYQGKWQMSYFVYGWGQSAYATSSIPIMFDETQLNADQFSKEKSYLLTFEAELDMARGNYNAALSNLKQAVSIAPSNIASWQAYIQAANHLNETGGLADQIKSAFTSLSSKAPYVLPGNTSPYNTTIDYESIISSLTSQIKS